MEFSDFQPRRNAAVAHVGRSDLCHFLGSVDLERIACNVRANITPPGPSYVEFHLTNRCNSSCYFCNQRQFRGTQDEIESGAFEALLSQFRDSGLKLVRLSGGGEPTIHSKIGRILDVLAKYDIAVARFDTNGIYFPRWLAEKLIALRLRTLHVSLQAPEPRSWARATGLPPSKFDAVLRNIAMFRTLDDGSPNVRVYISIALDEMTIGLVDHILEIEDHFGVEVDLHVLNSYVYTSDLLEKVDQSLGSLLNHPEGRGSERKMGKLARIRAQLQSNVQGPEVSHGRRNLADWPICVSPWAGALMKPDGALMPCCAGQVGFGNALQEGVQGAWHNAAFGQFRAEMHRVFLQHEEICESLLLPPSCFSDCPVRLSMFEHPAFVRISDQ